MRLASAAVADAPTVPDRSETLDASVNPRGPSSPPLPPGIDEVNRKPRAPEGTQIAKPLGPSGEGRPFHGLSGRATGP
jgi:hypothetical protein